MCILLYLENSHPLFRKPVVVSIKEAVIEELGPLRVSLGVKLRVSDQSLIQQVISLEAGCPYLRFHTEVCQRH